jgi:hypothetical protein
LAHRCPYCELIPLFSFFKKILAILAGGDCPAYKGGGRKCRGKLKDFVLDWEAALPEEDLEISDAQSKMADLRYGTFTSYPLPHDCVFSVKTI